jgi:hypothetical protein
MSLRSDAHGNPQLGGDPQIVEVQDVLLVILGADLRTQDASSPALSIL